MSAVHFHVEHTYKDSKQIWTHLDYARNMHERQAPISLLYKMLALLPNFLMFLYNSGQENKNFSVNANSVEY